jgi:hypothetical protein
MALLWLNPKGWAITPLDCLNDFVDRCRREQQAQGL